MIRCRGILRVGKYNNFRRCTLEVLGMFFWKLCQSLPWKLTSMNFCHTICFNCHIYIHFLELWSIRPQKKWRASSTKKFLIRPFIIRVCTGECGIKTVVEAFLSLLSVSFHLTTGGFVYSVRRSDLARSFMVTVNGARPRSFY